jgi:crotonobetainyl-CoA:carnitine CoA-transferase CaiB-like acyl-CoA transferase
VAVAGPMGTQLLADLGAEVVKVGALTDNFMTNSVFVMCHHGKRSVALDLKNPEGLDILYRMVERADVVHTNMRYNAVERLKVDYESLRAINPRLVYCHTRGHDRGPRMYVTGHDQSSACLTGTSWLEGATDNGGQPLWPVTSLGDVGSGLLSAIAVVQALYHRDRTGEGQFVDTAIVNAHLLNCSMSWVSADGARVGPRPRLDARQLGWNALYRLYATSDGRWLCLAVTDETAWTALCTALGHRGAELGARFATRAKRAEADAELATQLSALFERRTAAEWAALLDSAGVPAEISNNDYCLGLFDDPEMVAKGWVQSYAHPVLGKMDVAGLLFDFSDTPGRIWGPPFMPGQHTRELLAELGDTVAEIDGCLQRGTAYQATLEGA